MSCLLCEAFVKRIQESIERVLNVIILLFITTRGDGLCTRACNSGNLLNKQNWEEKWRRKTKHDPILTDTFTNRKQTTAILSHQKRKSAPEKQSEINSADDLLSIECTRVRLFMTWPRPCFNYFIIIIPATSADPNVSVTLPRYVCAVKWGKAITAVNRFKPIKSV